MLRSSNREADVKSCLAAIAILTLAGPAAATAMTGDSVRPGDVTIFDVSAPAGGSVADSATSLVVLLSQASWPALDGAEFGRAEARPGRGPAPGGDRDSATISTRSQLVGGETILSERMRWGGMTLGFGLVGFFGRGRRRTAMRAVDFETLRFRPQGVRRSVVC